MEILHPLALGVLAGLSVAVPPGAVTVLVVREALTHGRAVGLAAGFGVASTDTGYALLATLGGSTVAAPIEAHAGLVRVVAGSVLALIAVVGLHRSRRAVEVPRVALPRRSSVRTWARFAGVTVVNPTTTLAFAVVVLALGSRWDGAGERALFVLGVAIASAGWHALLALAAARAGARIRDRGRARAGVVGHALVLVLAVWVALGA